jgi:PKHD-type hydroxylase
VSSGERLAAVGWVQSMVRDPARRQILFDLEMLKRAAFEQRGKTRELDTLSKCASNLWRMWAEP